MKTTNRFLGVEWSVDSAGFEVFLSFGERHFKLRVPVYQDLGLERGLAAKASDGKLAAAFNR